MLLFVIACAGLVVVGGFVSYVLNSPTQDDDELFRERMLLDEEVR